ncbi:MAG: hypothetical protein E7639_05615 [Ruminococcaceae bacterium]|nr:hypothetical protein [Oscillospiraceae bacterium]
MNQTVLSLSLVGICAALCELLLPKGQGEGTKRALRALVSLAVLLIVLRPFVGFLQADPAFDLGAMLDTEAADSATYEEIFKKTVTAQGEADFKAGVLMLLENEYGIAAQDAEVRLCFDEDGALSLVKIYLSGKALLQDPHELGEALTARLGCKTEVR